MTENKTEEKIIAPPDLVEALQLTNVSIERTNHVEDY